MSYNIVSALLAGFIAATVWLGCAIIFTIDKTTSLVGAPVAFAIAFVIGVIVSKSVSGKTTAAN